MRPEWSQDPCLEDFICIIYLLGCCCFIGHKRLWWLERICWGRSTWEGSSKMNRLGSITPSLSLHVSEVKRSRSQLLFSVSAAEVLSTGIPASAVMESGRQISLHRPDYSICVSSRQRIMGNPTQSSWLGFMDHQRLSVGPMGRLGTNPSPHGSAGLQLRAQRSSGTKLTSEMTLERSWS